jgi:DNA-directed RNA polymerase specialized sigma24 family protein
MTNDEFEQVYFPKYDLTIRAISRKLGQTNDTLVEDLYQEGMIALWNCDPRRARENQDAYIRQAIKFRMIDFLRKERISEIESLEARLEKGEQLMLDSAGNLDLVSRRMPRTKHSNQYTEYLREEQEE